jgi:flagellar FliL protein
MADENKEVQEQQNEETKQSGGGGKLVTILVLLNTILIIAGGGYLLFFKKDPPPQIINKDAENKKIEKKKQEEENDEDSKEFGETHEYKGIIVNLNEPGGNRMLKISIAFEFKAKNKKLKEALTKREAQIRSVIIMYLSGLSYVQTTGSANKELILKTIKKKVNNVLTEGKIRKVFFKEFVVQ